MDRKELSLATQSCPVMTDYLGIPDLNLIGTLYWEEIVYLDDPRAYLLMIEAYV